MALLEDGRIYEFYWDVPYLRGVSGNIYMGRVGRVIQGGGAAFVDIGLCRPAYLNMGADSPKRYAEGEEILVQVLREPMANKGAKLTDRITLAGQYVAVEPGSQGIGISRKIHSAQERSRLREVLEELAPNDYRVVARTAAQGRNRQEIMQDLDFLQAQWARIQAGSAGLHAPAPVFRSQDLLMVAAQDMVTLGCKRLILDGEQDYDRVLRFVDSVAPDFDRAVELYTGPEPLFTRWNLVNEIMRIPGRVVDMGMNGTLVFDHTEALTSIDVNTGSHGAPGDREDAFFRTNLAAVHEIARQVRLRNIGGLIMIDLVTMNRPEHNDEVFQTMRMEMQKDRAHNTVLPVSPLGVIEMARQKLRQDTIAQMTTTCENCQGTGRRLPPREIASQILDTANSKIAVHGPGRLKIRACPEVIETLGSLYAASLGLLESRSGSPVSLHPVKGPDADHFDIDYTSVSQ